MENLLEFEDFLNENKNQDELYHVTTFEKGINILKHNYFRPSPGTIDVYGLSTTSDSNYFWGSKELRFVLSKKQLKTDFKLKEIEEEIYDENGKQLKETEIKVLSKNAIINANKYIKEIHYFKSLPIELKNQLEEYKNKFNIDFIKK